MQSSTWSPARGHRTCDFGGIAIAAALPTIGIIAGSMALAFAAMRSQNCPTTFVALCWSIRMNRFVAKM
jgi:hypothetical protein